MLLRPRPPSGVAHCGRARRGVKEEGRKLLRCSTGLDFVFSGSVHMFRKRKSVRLGCVEIEACFVYLYYFLSLGLISSRIFFLFIF